MATKRTPRGSTRRTLSNIIMALGALVMMVMPAILFVASLSADKAVDLPGTLVLISSAGGMALIVIGAMLRE